MRFEQLHLLNGLWLLLLLILFFYWAARNKRRILFKFFQSNLMDVVVPNVSERNNIIKILLIILIFFFSIVALARPQWGFRWQEVKRKGIDILVVVDVSKSMLTQDVKPNRLERTKLAVKDLLKKLKGDRIGLIAFAGEAFNVCPLTVDYNGFNLSLNDLNVDTIPRGGTNLSKAIQEAIKNYDDTPSQHKAVIIVTDGDDLEGKPKEVIEKAKKKGIKIYSVGIGTSEGELIRVRNNQGEWEFLKDNNGNFVKSRLNEKLLKEIALSTGGLYVRASGAEFGLDLIYEQELSKMQKRDIESKMEKKYFERFQFPLAIAVMFLVTETCLGVRRRE